MRHTIAEVDDGVQVWMYLPDLHDSHPLQVTVGKLNYDVNYLMPSRNVTIKMCTQEGSVCIKRSYSACSFCYDTEAEAQEVIDNEIKRSEEKREKLKDFYWKVADEYVNKKIHFDTEEHAFYFKAGFVDACMMLRDKDYLLKVNPPVPGTTEIKGNNDLWEKYMKEN